MPVAELDAGELLLLPVGHCLRDQVLGACTEFSQPPPAGRLGNSLETLRSMVASGLGVTVLPKTALTERYGQKNAQVMICALTHDNPSSDCQSNSSSAAIGIAVVVGAAIAATAATLMLRSRRRRPPAGK